MEWTQGCSKGELAIALYVCHKFNAKKLNSRFVFTEKMIKFKELFRLLIKFQDMTVKIKQIASPYMGLPLILLCFQLSTVFAKDAIEASRIDSLFDLAYQLEQNYPDSAIAIYERSGQIAIDIKDPQREGQSHHYRALVMFNTGDLDDALTHYTIAQELYDIAGDESGVAAMKANIGNIWLMTGDYETAIELYFEAVEKFQEIGDTLRLLINYMNMGSLFLKNQHYSDGLRYSQLALELARDMDDPRTFAEIHHNISLNYYKLDSIESYFCHMLKARDYAIESGHLYVEMLTYNSHLEYHIDHERPDSALYYARLNMDAAERFGNPYNLTGTYNMAATAYILANNYQRALELLQKALSIGEENNFLPMLAWSNESLARVYAELGDYRRAHSHATALNALKDSVFKMEQQEKILSMDRKFNVAQTQNQLEQKQLTLQLQHQQLKRSNTLTQIERLSLTI